VFDAKAQTIQNSNRPWGVEFNAVWPFVPVVEIYTAKATRTIWTKEKAHGTLPLVSYYDRGLAKMKMQKNSQDLV